MWIDGSSGLRFGPVAGECMFEQQITEKKVGYTGLDLSFVFDKD